MTDTAARRVAHGEVIARRFAGTRDDFGSKEGFLPANLAFGRRIGLVDSPARRPTGSAGSLTAPMPESP